MIVNDWKLLFIFEKHSILDVWLGYAYSSGLLVRFVMLFNLLANIKEMIYKATSLVIILRWNKSLIH